MSWDKDVRIYCDGCEQAWVGAARTATEVREMMKEDDWVNRGAEDYCPRCK